MKKGPHMQSFLILCNSGLIPPREHGQNALKKQTRKSAIVHELTHKKTHPTTEEKIENRLIFQ